MRLGIDVSTYFDEIKRGAKYYDGEKEVEPLSLFRQNGADIMRIRLWVDPKSEKGEPYLGGDCDTENFLKLCRVAGEKGYKVMADFHYSDFWTDPSKQYLPKSWQNASFCEVVERVYSYTRETLALAKKEGVDIEFIQVGNEITNGMMWEYGRLDGEGGSRTGYPNLIKLIKSGCKACREVYPEAKIILHLERSYDKVIYNEFFTNMRQADVDYDIIGFSYYPYWHGTFAQFYENVDMCKKFGKELMVVELGYAFTLEDYLKHGHGGAQLVFGNGTLSSFGTEMEYPVSRGGQAAFTRDFLSLAKEHGVSGVIWWEPLWLPLDGVCWASAAGQRYIGEEGKSTRNEWANQCLFDYEGRKLPALDEFKVKNK